jgi:hypothetical protein
LENISPQLLGKSSLLLNVQMNKPTIKVARGSEILGEYEPDKIREFLASGSLVLGDLFWNDTANEWQPLSRLSFNSFSKLRAWFKNSNPRRNKTLVVGIALALLIASWLYPPGFYRDHSHNWFFLFDTRSVMRVDFERLILVDAIIIVLAGAVTWAGSQWRLNLLPVGLSIMGGVLFIVAGAISWRLVAAQIEQSKMVERRRVSTAEAEIQQARALQARAASQVLPDDLKRIAVFDCYYNSNIRAVEGRIMNRLPRRRPHSRQLFVSTRTLQQLPLGLLVRGVPAYSQARCVDSHTDRTQVAHWACCCVSLSRLRCR